MTKAKFLQAWQRNNSLGAGTKTPVANIIHLPVTDPGGYQKETGLWEFLLELTDSGLGLSWGERGLSQPGKADLMV